MSVKEKISDFYSDKKYFVNLDRHKTNDLLLNKKLDILGQHLDNGFTLYKTLYLEKFIMGHLDIQDFAEQFIKLNEYHKHNSVFGNTLEKMTLTYGRTLGSLLYEQKQIKNPFRNHRGRLSPWKKGSVNYSKDAIEKAENNRSYNTRLEYYLDQGYSEEESKLLLSERQATFSLERCIVKHGEIEGTKIWRERQDKWQNTLKNKPQEEIDRINSLKGLGSVNYFSEDIAGILYYIEFYNDDERFWKIGITTNSARKRFFLPTFEVRTGLKHKILFEVEFDSMMSAYNEEQRILRKYKDNRITVKYPDFSTTESFNTDIFKGNYEIY